MILLGAGRLEAYSLEIDLIEKLKRIYYFAKRMAKDVIPDELLNKAA
jgi:phosphate:Na+ symporter